MMRNRVEPEKTDRRGAASDSTKGHTINDLLKEGSTMTNHKFSYKRIEQALGILTLGLALLVVSSERAFAPAPATLTLSATWIPVLVSATGPVTGPYGFKGIATLSGDSETETVFLVANELSDTMMIVEGSHHTSPGQPGHSGGVQFAKGSAPHSVDVAEVAVAASVANSGAKDGAASQVRTSQAQQTRLLAFTANFGSNDVSVVEINKQGDKLEARVVETIKVGRQPTSLDFDPNSNKLYVNNFGSNSVSVIDVKATGGSKVIATITGFREPIFVRIAPDGKGATSALRDLAKASPSSIRLRTPS